MRIFNKYHEKRTLSWYFQWGCFTRYEKTVVSLEFNFPTPKDKSFFFGFTLLTVTLFFIEIAKVDPVPEYVHDWR